MKRKASYDARYRRKLNTLEPGALMLKIAGVLALIGVVAHGLKMHLIAVILLSAAGVIAAALLILVRVELHQDRILNEIAQRENVEAERRFRPPV